MEHKAENLWSCAEESLDLKRAHLPRMPLAVKKDVPLDPISVSGFRANRIMLEAHYFADLIEQLKLGIGDDQVGSTRLLGKIRWAPAMLTILINVHMLMQVANETRNRFPVCRLLSA